MFSYFLLVLDCSKHSSSLKSDSFTHNKVKNLVYSEDFFKQKYSLLSNPDCCSLFEDAAITRACMCILIYMFWTCIYVHIHLYVLDMHVCTHTSVHVLHMHMCTHTSVCSGHACMYTQVCTFRTVFFLNR